MRGARLAPGIARGWAGYRGSFTFDGWRLAVLHDCATEISRFLLGSTPEPALAMELAQRAAPVFASMRARSACRPMTARRMAGSPCCCPAAAASWWSSFRFPTTTQAGAAATRAARLPEGYAAGLETGLWSSRDVLPSVELARRGHALELLSLRW